MRVLFLILLLAGCAAAPPNKAAVTLTATLWADMGYPGYNPPEVRTIQPAEMAVMRSNFTVATYICRERKMYIRADHATESDWLSGVLVHELTHHRQCVEGRLAYVKDMCPLEVEAYRAQIAWLEKQAELRGFIMGTNARNMAGEVQKHMDRNFSRCL